MHVPLAHRCPDCRSRKFQHLELDQRQRKILALTVTITLNFIILIRVIKSFKKLALHFIAERVESFWPIHGQRRYDQRLILEGIEFRHDFL